MCGTEREITEKPFCKMISLKFIKLKSESWNPLYGKDSSFLCFSLHQLSIEEYLF